MGRRISSGGRGGGGGGTPSVYAPGRLYGPVGHGGGVIHPSGFAGAMWSPFLVGPGVHRVVGLWAAIGAAGGAVRLGLWDDANGRPGALIKDAGETVAVLRSYLKVTFAAVEIDAGETGRMLHFGAVAAGPSLIGRYARGSSNDAGPPEDPLTMVGLDPGAFFSADAGNDAVINLTPGVRLAAGAISPATPFGNAPDLSGATGAGLLTAGLIFGD